MLSDHRYAYNIWNLVCNMFLTTSKGSSIQHMTNGSLLQSLRRLRFQELATEVENKLVSILLKVSVRYPMEGSGQKTLEVADDDMNLRKPLIHSFVCGDLRYLPMRFAQNSQSKESICANFRILQDSPRKFRNLFRVHPLNEKRCHEAHVVLPVFRRENYRLITLGTATSIAWFSDGDEDIIHIDKQIKPVFAVVILHGLAQFPQHSICCQQSHANQVRKPFSQNFVFVSFSQINRRKPFRQQQSSMLINCPRHRLNLISTFDALVQVKMFLLAGFFVPAFRKHESVLPTVLVQLFRTSFPSRGFSCSFKNIVEFCCIRNFLESILNQTVTVYSRINFYNILWNIF